MSDPEVHQCVREACTGLACYGFGLPPGPVIWACSEHRAEVQKAREERLASSDAAKTARQGSLL